MRQKYMPKSIISSAPCGYPSVFRYSETAFSLYQKRSLCNACIRSSSFFRLKEGPPKGHVLKKPGNNFLIRHTSPDALFKLIICSGDSRWKIISLIKWV